MFLTGLATGAYKDIKQIKTLLKEQKLYKPNKTQLDVLPQIKAWKSAVKKCLRK